MTLDKHVPPFRFRSRSGRSPRYLLVRPGLVVPGLVLLGFVMVSLLACGHPYTQGAHAQTPQAQAAKHQRKPMIYEGSPGGWRMLEEGQRPAMIHATLEYMTRYHETHPARAQAAAAPTNLDYGGGTGGVGVETAPKVYLVLWGSQWNNNDPSGESAILQSFYRAVGSSSWLNSVTQYCQGVPAGTVSCNGAGTPAGDPANMFAGFWADNAAAAPGSPSQSQFGTEAVRAAQHFGNNTAASNASTQYVIATATGNNSPGFQTQFCAYHSSTNGATLGNVAFTNLPYMTDAGATCGANFNGLGPNAGITIVAGHEMAESITDQFPNGGWLDSSGAENGDKCAWIPTGQQGASANVTLADKNLYPVQSLWSNAFSSGAGGCVLSYP